MPERRGGRRRLNITGCKHVYKGTNSKGNEFNIYEVEATSDSGVVIQDKLTSWVELPLGAREFDVTPYEKDGMFKSWTLSVPKEAGGNAAAAREALAKRVEHLEGQVEWLVGKLSALEARLGQAPETPPLPGPQQQPVTTVTVGTGDDAMDVPF